MTTNRTCFLFKARYKNQQTHHTQFTCTNQTHILQTHTASPTRYLLISAEIQLVMVAKLKQHCAAPQRLYLHVKGCWLPVSPPPVPQSPPTTIWPLSSWLPCPLCCAQHSSRSLPCRCHGKGPPVVTTLLRV